MGFLLHVGLSESSPISSPEHQLLGSMIMVRRWWILKMSPCTRRISVSGWRPVSLQRHRAVVALSRHGRVEEGRPGRRVVAQSEAGRKFHSPGVSGPARVHVRGADVAAVLAGHAVRRGGVGWSAAAGSARRSSRFGRTSSVTLIWVTLSIITAMLPG